MCLPSGNGDAHCRAPSPGTPALRAAGRRGFIFIFFGSKPKISDDRDAEPLEAICPACHQRTRMLPKKRRLWFTLFFMPVVPMSGPTPLSICEKCGAGFRMSVDDLKRRLDRAQVSVGGQAMEAAIRLYNELRDHPTDSVLLDRVMRAYAAAGEFGEAASTARHFPEALATSVTCQETLRQIEEAGRQQTAPSA